jgi:uncharacterized protein (DUF697 family)/predicted GTPase
MRPSDEFEEPIAERARALAPVVWLVGKVQSGKTSIIRELTQAPEAEVGSGFRACTRSARVFDFPAEAPIIRFLDTRGLGEANYDASEDIAFCEGRAHLILAVVKALDPAQETVLETARAARSRHPDWPVVIVQTSLHEAYSLGAGHIQPYPFREGATNAARVPEALQRALAYQRELFRSLARPSLAFVPIDFTSPGDGLEPRDYGREALLEALAAAAPVALSLALDELPRARDASALSRSNAHILGFALAAGASDALPAISVATVPIMQAAMLRQIAKLQGSRWDRRAYAEFAGALGLSTLLRVASGFGIRQLVKLLPVYGQTAGAATSAASTFATTYAIGKAAQHYLARREQGVRSGEIVSVYRSALRDAFHLAKERRLDAGQAAEKQ